MPTPKSALPWQRALILQSGVITTALILTLLYVARSIIIPVAMALFFSYVLAPVVRFLGRHGFGRHMSVLVTVAVTTCLVLGTSFAVTRQITSLSQTLTANADQIKEKITNARNAIVGTENSEFQKMIDDIVKIVTGGAKEGTATSKQETVVVASEQPRWLTSVDSLIGPLTEAFGMAAFSFLLVVFILLAREDLKDRLLRLTGDGAVSSTTRALDDATTRLSQYLLAQLTLNVAFGIVIMFGVWLIGLKYVLLWGFIAAIMRYVPYIGTWIGLVFPALFSLATSPDWWQPLSVVVFYAALELVVGNVIEPVLYGTKLGVSEVAQLISAAFWSWLWGPIGLILSGPIATCLVVLGRHAPRFRFLSVLLGTEPPLPPPVALFQRCMTGDADEALRIIENNVPEGEPQQVYDTLLVPTLVQVKAALHSGEFSADEQQVLLKTTREVIADTIANQEQPATDAADPVDRSRLLVIPARDAADQLALDMLTALLPIKKWKVDVAGVDTLAAELVERVAESKPDVVCIGSLPPAGLVQVRYLCKRLRQHNADVRILVGRWGDEGGPDAFAELRGVGATAVEVKVEHTLAQLTAWRPLTETEAPSEKKAAPPAGVGTGRAQPSGVVS